MYQWGRKDPFPGGDDVESSVQKRLYDINGNQIYVKTELRPTYNDNTSTNLQLAIEHPDVFYYAPSSSWPAVDWLTDKASCRTTTCGAARPMPRQSTTHALKDGGCLPQETDGASEPSTRKPAS